MMFLLAPRGWEEREKTMKTPKSLYFSGKGSVDVHIISKGNRLLVKTSNPDFRGVTD